MFFIKYLILFSLLSKSLGVGLEYYADQDDSTIMSHIVTKDSNARRTLDKNSLSNINLSNVSVNKTLFSMDKNNNNKKDEVEDNIVSYNIATRKQRLEKPFTTKNIPIFLQDFNRSTVVVKSEKTTFHTTLSLYFNSFEEYDYKYENETDYEDDLQALRHQDNIQKSTESQNKTQVDTPYAKFYNLEPAVAKELNINVTKYSLDKIWYVPQDFPCWDLPILYGELGLKKKKSNVFLIFGGNLINVVDPSTKTRSSYKPIEPPMSHIVNKWCEVEPCYGDHTLCLFPNTGISNICDKEYKVHVPTILDQFALVNTINTMRNHIANGLSRKYPHLPTAANMKQITYDYDLEEMAEAWLRQCLPGSAPCSALDGNLVSHLECTKYVKYCCSEKSNSQCTPRPECYVYPIIGCLHIWFSSAGKNLKEIDIRCGRTSVSTFNTAQLLWAKTCKIGCAFGERASGDIRVVCNFSPGAPFYLETKLYCGIIAHNDIEYLRNVENLTNLLYLASLGIQWSSVIKLSHENIAPKEDTTTIDTDFEIATTIKSDWGIDSLTKLYKEGWVRKQLGDSVNGTISLAARLVAKYTFIDESESRCDSDESIYVIGSPGSLCVEKGGTYHGLCYDFRDPTPGYRLIAIAASIALFSLILYDLFSGVLRQTNI